jgi:hypothetical protein
MRLQLRPTNPFLRLDRQSPHQGGSMNAHSRLKNSSLDSRYPHRLAVTWRSAQDHEGHTKTEVTTEEDETRSEILTCNQGRLIVGRG